MGGGSARQVRSRGSKVNGAGVPVVILLKSGWSVAGSRRPGRVAGGEVVLRPWNRHNAVHE